MPLIEVASEDPTAATLDPDANRVPQLGILALTLDDSTRHSLPPTRLPTGVVVAARTTDTRSATLPLVMGDVIHAVNGIAVHTVGELRTILASLGAQEAVVLQVERGGLLRYVAARTN